MNRRQKDDYKIFLKEVELFSPKVIVLFTGDGWGWDYLCTINNNGNPSDEQILPEYEWAGYHAKVYRIDNRIVILSEHPQTRPEQEHIECITKIISKYAQL